jgi:colanic acid biosynthesis protein WcaH
MLNIPEDVYAKIHELMPIVCVDCVVSYDNKILLVKRKREPMKSAWWFPGGRLVRNEKLDSAVSRIVRNETGVSLHRPTPIGYDETEFETDPFGHGEGTHTVNFVYASYISEIAMMKITLDDDHVAHSMFTYEEIYRSNMHPYVKRFTAIAEGVLRK